MRVAVIADIHGDLEAFEQVLIDIDKSRVDAVMCLGDCIGAHLCVEPLFSQEKRWLWSADAVPSLLLGM